MSNRFRKRLCFRRSHHDYFNFLFSANQTMETYCKDKSIGSLRLRPCYSACIKNKDSKFLFYLSHGSMPKQTNRSRSRGFKGAFTPQSQNGCALNKMYFKFINFNRAFQAKMSNCNSKPNFWL